MKYLVLFCFCVSLTFLAFVPSQSDFALIICGFSVAFASYVLLIRKTEFSLWLLMGVGIALRFLFIFSYPNLSDDIHRFIWDGYLLHLGENPFEYLPSEYIKTSNDSILISLFPKLNSPDYFSIYPPIAQLVFYLSTFSWMNSAIVIKCVLFIAEVVTLLSGTKLLKLLGKNERAMLWYALNPLVIIEIMVNIHFEGLMISFFILFAFLLYVKRDLLASIFMACSIGTKLIPLMFLPYFLFKWRWKRLLLFYLSLGAILIVLFIPLVMQLEGFSDSLDLYFRKFEFNASVYFVLRYLGNLWKGYNMIASIGPLMAIAVFCIIIFLAYKFRDFFVFCQWSLLVFLLFSTTIHPWYLSLGVLLSVFTRDRFFILWSFIVLLSYSKYGLSDFEYYWLVAAEYSILMGYLLWIALYGKSKRNELSPFVF